MNMLLQDLRHGLRRLMRSPAFAGLIVLSLGLGIAANVTLFRFLTARLGERDGFRALAGTRTPEWPASTAGGRTACLHIAVIGIHTTVSYRLAHRSGEIGVRVAFGDAGGKSCA